MVLNIDVFDARMELRVFGQGHGALIIIIDHHCLGGLIAGIELIKKATQPNGFLNSLRLADILGLTG